MEIDFKVEGLRELERNLLELAEEYGPKNALGALRKPMRDALTPVKSAISANTPVDTGALKNSVTIRITQATRKDRDAVYINPDSILIARVGWFWRRPSLWSRALAVEFGNSQVSAQPVIMPAFDGQQRQILTTFRNGLQKSIEQTARRLEKRVAKGTFKRK